MKTTERNIGEVIVGISRILLISLWTYTAFMKFGNMENNLDSMHKQFFPVYVGSVLAYLLPMMAIVTVIFLFYRIKTGFLLSIGLLSSFTLFILVAFAEIFAGQTCACAGIFPRQGYVFHLVLNIVMLAMAVTGLVIYSKQIRGDAENRHQSRHYTLFYKQHN